MDEEVIPLDKLIVRLSTDLKLAEKYRNDLTEGYPLPEAKIERKNLRKYSILQYLMELKRIKEEKEND